MQGSDTLSWLEAQLRQLGLWSRTLVQVEEPDPEGGMAGCFHAHVRAWQASQACRNLLVLEDDAFFENGTVQRGMHHVEAFLQSEPVYDLMLLGWSGHPTPPESVSVRQVEGVECIFAITGTWALTHAYIISNTAMHDFKGMQWKEHSTAIDHDLSSFRDRGLFVTVRPEIAFQRAHPLTTTETPFHNASSILKAWTEWMHYYDEGPVYAASDLANSCRP